MPERHLLVPTSIVTLKTGPQYTSDREDLFLLFSKGIENGKGRGIYRDGIGSPWMWDDTASRRITDPDEQRRGSWLLDRDYALNLEINSLNTKKKNEKFRRRIADELRRDPDDVLDEWIQELLNTPDYISEFNKIYNPKFQLIGAQGCGNLTMNSWFIGFVNSEFTGGVPTFLYRREEPFQERSYTCLVKWKNERGYSIEPLKFNLYSDNIKRSGQSNDLKDDIEFAIFGQRLVAGGQIEDFRHIVNQFEDIRHLFKLPNINPDIDFPGISNPKRPRFLFGDEREDDVWLGEREMRAEGNENLLRYALTEPILLNRQFHTMGASWDLVRAALATTSGGGYRELKSEEVSHSPRARGEWREYSDNYMEIYLQRNVYAYTMLGLNDNGNIIASAAGGLAGNVGQTLEGMAQNMISAGARDVLLIDEGNDVFQSLQEDYTVKPRRGRLRAAFIFAKQSNADSSSADGSQEFQRPAEI